MHLEMECKINSKSAYVEEYDIRVSKLIEDTVKDFSWLSHLKFGHLNFEGLNLVSNENMVNWLLLIVKPTISYFSLMIFHAKIEFIFLHRK